MQTPMNWKKEIFAKEISRKYENYEKAFVVFLQAEGSKLKRFETQGSSPICGRVIKFHENGNAANFSEMYLSQSSNVFVQYIGCKFLWNFVLHQEGCHCSDCSAIFSEPSEFALSTLPEGRMKKIGFTLKCIFLNLPAWCIRNKSKGKISCDWISISITLFPCLGRIVIR